MNQNEFNNLQPGDILGWYESRDYIEVQLVEKIPDGWRARTIKNNVNPKHVGFFQLVSIIDKWNVISRKVNNMKLWVVWSPSANINPADGDNFTTEAAAVTKAQELALRYPRDKFYVCQTIGLATCNIVNYTKIE